MILELALFLLGFSVGSFAAATFYAVRTVLRLERVEEAGQ